MISQILKSAVGEIQEALSSQNNLYHVGKTCTDVGMPLHNFMLLLVIH